MPSTASPPPPRTSSARRSPPSRWSPRSWRAKRPREGSFAEDIALLQSQAERCREILKKLTRGPTEPDPLHARISVRELIDEAAAPYRGFNAEIVDHAGAGAR